MGAAEGPQWARLLQIVKGTNPFTSEEAEAFISNGCYVKGEAKSDNLRKINYATGAWLVRDYETDLRWSYRRDAERLFTDEDTAWCGNEPGSTTYQAHTISATHLWLDAATGHMAWLQPYLELALSRHYLWCHLHAGFGGLVASCGLRCGTATDAPRNDWYTSNRKPTTKGWRKWVKYEWIRSEKPFERYCDAHVDLRLAAEVTIVQGEHGHISTLDVEKVKVGSPPPLWGAHLDYRTGAVTIQRNRDEPLVVNIGRVTDRIVIDADGVHRGV